MSARLPVDDQHVEQALACEHGRLVHARDQVGSLRDEADRQPERGLVVGERERVDRHRAHVVVHAPQVVLGHAEGTEQQPHHHLQLRAVQHDRVAARREPHRREPLQVHAARLQLVPLPPDAACRAEECRTQRGRRIQRMCAKESDTARARFGSAARAAFYRGSSPTTAAHAGRRTSARWRPCSRSACS
eukprot:6588725-Prymnesium_polylepis.1